VINSYSKTKEIH